VIFRRAFLQLSGALLTTLIDSGLEKFALIENNIIDNDGHEVGKKPQSLPIETSK
jgi:hypothetical protein